MNILNIIKDAEQSGFLDDMDSRDMALYVKENALQLYENEMDEKENLDLRIGYLMCSLVLYAHKHGMDAVQCFNRAVSTYIQEN